MSQSDLQSAIADLVANPPIRSGYPCKIARIMSTLSDDDGRALEDLIDNSRISASAIARLLTENGFDVRQAIVSKHRRRIDGTGCRCPKQAKP